MSCRGDLGPAHRVRKNRVVAGSLTVEILVVVTSWPCVCSAEDAGGAEKKPKVEMSEDELRAHVQKGTLGKLTVWGEGHRDQETGANRHLEGTARKMRRRCQYVSVDFLVRSTWKQDY